MLATSYLTVKSGRIRTGHQSLLLLCFCNPLYLPERRRRVRGRLISLCKLHELRRARSCSVCSILRQLLYGPRPRDNYSQSFGSHSTKTPPCRFSLITVCGPTTGNHLT